MVSILFTINILLKSPHTIKINKLNLNAYNYSVSVDPKYLQQINPPKTELFWFKNKNGKFIFKHKSFYIDFKNN